MIEHLTVSRAAYFYARKKPLSQEAIRRLFRILRAQTTSPSQNLFYLNKVEQGGAACSAICFSFERAPSFLEHAAGATERVFGFLMLIERGGLVAVIKAGLDLPSWFKSDFLSKVANDKVERAIARHDAVFEQLRLKNMSPSKMALRSKAFEASDLENTVPTASANRFVALGYRVRRPDGNYSATPGTGRISIRSDRANHLQIIAWANAVIDALEADNEPSAPFIRNFARPLELTAIPAGVRPTFIAIDVPALSERLLEADASFRLVEERDGVQVALTDAETHQILEALDESFSVRVSRSGLKVVAADGNSQIGAVKIGKTRISLQKFALPAVERVAIEDRTFLPGEDPEGKPLARYLDREDLFAVLFSDLAIAYVDGALFRDEALAGGGENFLRHLIAEPLLAQANSEKGNFADGQIAFSEHSVFRSVVDRTANDCDVLLCDDLGDEWADFIGLTTRASPTMVSFYHAKHGARSLSAAAFHDAVGQAMKNLGRMALPVEAMAAKYTSWQEPYRNNGAVTAISRMMRGGTRADIEAAVTTARRAPDLVKRVFIVTSSLSRAQVARVFADAAAGVAPSAHFVQLYWLLTTFFASCAEMGAASYIVCQP
ncbi:hypothetical protein AB0V79_24375 [Mesorhizobium ciceri]|uniref:hypothetical protein n=1 Tax=Mesorhizobium TaxID=68287 RepID=UPI000AF9DAC1|nr:hypothetical protein [Mesorhizobium ciceri]